MPTVRLPPITSAPAYHWTGANQRRFLETLAQTGVVSLAAKAVAMSSQAAYEFRTRAAGRVFALGWLAAILLSRDRLVDDLMERAFMGQEEEMIRDPDNNRLVRKRIDNRLGMGMLGRLDRMVEAAAGVVAGQGDAFTQSARLVAGDFERFLDLVEREGGGAETGLFLATHADTQTSAFHYQLPQNNAAFEDDSGEEAEPEPPTSDAEHEASFLKVWWDDQSDDWRTDFPPPADFDGDEEGCYGEESYVRALSDEEAEIYEARLAMENRPYVAAAQDARDAWFAVDADVQAELDQRAAKAAAEREKSEAEANRRAEEAARANALACKDMERLANAHIEPMEDRREDYADEFKGTELIQAPQVDKAKAAIHPRSGVAGFRTISMPQKPRPLFGIYGDKPPSQGSVW